MNHPITDSVGPCVLRACPIPPTHKWRASSRENLRLSPNVREVEVRSPLMLGLAVACGLCALSRLRLSDVEYSPTMIYVLKGLD